MAYRSASSIAKPSEQLFDLLMGKTEWDDAPEAIRSWARKPIYDAAVEILQIEGKGNRRNALSRIPAAIRPKIEAEMVRLHNRR